MTPRILLSDGRFFDLANPDGVVSIEVIARSLSRLCRFTGHMKPEVEHYSVAQHSVLVSRLVPPKFARQGLLHDIAEALLGDVSAPLKRLLPDYRAIEHKVERSLFAWFGLPAELDPCVKYADLVALVTEKRDLMATPTDDTGEWRDTDHIPAAFATIYPWTARAAEAAFLERYRELTA
jgi:5'-deoxynucleotidase YfbR-like HD superfamily hydrolase